MLNDKKKIEWEAYGLPNPLWFVPAVAVFAMFLACAISAHAQGLGNGEAEFQAIKAKIKDQIQGSQATVSEVIMPDFSEADLEKIALARQQLKDVNR